MWKAMRSAWLKTSAPLPEILVSASVAQKLVLTDPSRERIILLCAATHSYHIIKNVYRNQFLNYGRNRNYGEFARITIEVSKAAIIRCSAMM